MRRGISFERMQIALLFIAFGALAALTPAQNDTFWHLRAGQDIWRTGQVPRVETYSFTAAGNPWPDHEWLSQALMYGAVRLGGMPGLELAAVVTLLAALALAYRLMVGSSRLRFALMAAILPASASVWTLRPQILTLLCLVVLLALLIKERHWWIPPFFFVWANAHGGVVLGALVLFVAAVAAVLRWRLVGATQGDSKDRRRALTLLAVGVASIVASSATPLGPRLFPFVLESLNRVLPLQIEEWLPPYPTDLVGILFWPLALGFLTLVVTRFRRLRQAGWGDWAAVVAPLALLPLAFRSGRNVGPFLILLAPAASRLLGADFRWPRRTASPPAAASADSPRANLGIVVAATLGAVAFITYAWSVPLPRLRWHPLPDAAIAAIRACPGPLYNHYNQGGELTWFVPERPVFLDSRNDPYPVSLMLSQHAVEVDDAPYRPLFERWGIRCAFLSVASPTGPALVADGWNIRFRDDDWVVLER